MSISSPSTYLDLARAFVFKHNELTDSDLTVVDQPPYIIDASEGLDLIRSIEETRIRNEAARSALATDVAARIEWWAARVAESGLDGTPREIKHQLKRQGMRFPADATRGNEHGS
ncbi:hypothetical protein G6L37_05310 [Agrobacterium rubi]|nr:hypothetical protein [Agrobacterium rubi]NTF24775.1 hypothetical protein [Agrobacterium rubi]